eukprot:1070592-Amphidinium_carterae.1
MGNARVQRKFLVCSDLNSVCNDCCVAMVIIARYCNNYRLVPLELTDSCVVNMEPSHRKGWGGGHTPNQAPAPTIATHGAESLRVPGPSAGRAGSKKGIDSKPRK